MVRTYEILNAKGKPKIFCKYLKEEEKQQVHILND